MTSLSLGFLKEVTVDESAALSFLRSRSCLRSIPPPCGAEHCDRDMTQVRNGDRLVFRCPAHKARKLSIRCGSLFYQSNLPLAKIIELIYCWALEIPVKTAQIMADVNKNTVLQWYTLIRIVCETVLDGSEVQSLVLDAEARSRCAQDVWARCKSASKEARPKAADRHRADARWRDLYGKTPAEAFDNFLHHVSLWFPTY